MLFEGTPLFPVNIGFSAECFTVDKTKPNITIPSSFSRAFPLVPDNPLFSNSQMKLFQKKEGGNPLPIAVVETIPTYLVSSLLHTVKSLYRTNIQQTMQGNFGIRTTFENGRVVGDKIAEYLGEAGLARLSSHKMPIAYENSIFDDKEIDKKSVFPDMKVLIQPTKSHNRKQTAFEKQYLKHDLVKLLDALVAVPMAIICPSGLYLERVASGRRAGAYRDIGDVLSYCALSPYFLRDYTLTSMVISTVELVCRLSVHEDSKRVLSLMDEKLVQNVVNRLDKAAAEEATEKLQFIFSQVPDHLVSHSSLANSRKFALWKFIKENNKFRKEKLSMFGNDTLNTTALELDKFVECDTSYNKQYKEILNGLGWKR